jgi:hypothetical protein
MKVSGKISMWIRVLLVFSAIFIVPNVSNATLLEQVKSWFNNDAETVENVQDNDDDSLDAAEKAMAGKMMVRINHDMADDVGIETTLLVETNFFPESKALATVVDLRPMLALRTRHHQALAALNVANVTERAAAAELARLKMLAKGAGSIATKNVNYAEADLLAAKAKLQGLKFDEQAVRNEATQVWGEVVASWILTEDSKEWQRLLSRQDSLLLVTLPIDLTLAADVSFIRVALNGERKNAPKAYFVSSALPTDQMTQSETYFFKTASRKLRTGMRVDVWLPEGSKALAGVFIPDQAIIWNEGQAWAYVKLEDDLYQRKSLLAGLPAAGGVFMTDGIKTGATLVVRGGQMLLSEEFRWQIEDDD